MCQQMYLTNCQQSLPKAFGCALLETIFLFFLTTFNAMKEPAKRHKKPRKRSTIQPPPANKQVPAVKAMKTKSYPSPNLFNKQQP